MTTRYAGLILTAFEAEAARLHMFVPLVFRSPLSKKGAGQWHPPAGRIEAGETAADCAMRECREETGIAAFLDGEALIALPPCVGLDDVEWYGVAVPMRSRHLPSLKGDMTGRWWSFEELGAAPPILFGGANVKYALLDWVKETMRRVGPSHWAGPRCQKGA